MSGSSRYAWGRAVTVLYALLSLAGTAILAPMFASQPAQPTAEYRAPVEDDASSESLVLTSIVILTGFAGLGVVLLVAVGTFADQLSEASRAARHGKHTWRHSVYPKHWVHAPDPSRVRKRQDE